MTAVFTDVDLNPGSINPFRTAVSFWGKSTQILSSFPPNRDCGTKRVFLSGDPPSGLCTLIVNGSFLCVHLLSCAPSFLLIVQSSLLYCLSSLLFVLSWVSSSAVCLSFLSCCFFASLSLLLFLLSIGFLFSPFSIHFLLGILLSFVHPFHVLFLLFLLFILFNTITGGDS